MAGGWRAENAGSQRWGVPKENTYRLEFEGTVQWAYGTAACPKVPQKAPSPGSMVNLAGGEPGIEIPLCRRGT